MDYFDILLAKKLSGGGGGEIVLEDITITENGEVTAPSGKAYKKITTDVPLPPNAYLLKDVDGLPSDIATFSDGADDMPLTKLECSIDSACNGAKIINSSDGVINSDNALYTYRATPYNDANVLETIVGGTVAWNQQFSLNNLPADSALYSSNTYTANGVTFTKNNDGSITIQTESGGATERTSVKIGSDYTLPFIQRHIHLIGACKGGSTSTYFFNYASSRNVGDAPKVFSAQTSGFNLWLIVESGTVITTPVKVYPQIMDLEQAFGSTIADYVYTLEQATSGRGIAWLKSYGFLTKDNYPYDSGSLQSVKTSGRKIVGKNLCPTPIESNIIYKNGSQYMSFVFTDSGTITWNISATASTFFVLKVFDITTEMVGKTFTMSYKSTPSIDDDNTVMEVYYGGTTHNVIGKTGTITSDMVGYPLGIRFYRYGSGTHEISDVQVEFGSPATSYEPYKTLSYPLDSDLTLRGIPKLDANNSLYYDGDTYESDGSVTRKYGVRAYESGDESLADAITDGTNTVYKLTTSTSESAQPFTNPQKVLANGTEEYVDTRNVAIPVGHESIYYNGNGYYVPFPTTISSGTYDVVDGTITSGQDEYNVNPLGIKSVEGVNNVWGDCGDVTELSYFSKPSEG